MKLQLINSPSLVEKDYGALGKQMFPPLGILYLASYVRNQFPDIQIKVTDGLRIGKDKTLKEVRNFDPEIIGISCTTPSSTGAYELTNYLKNINPTALILLGGVHPTAMPEDAVRRSEADLIVLGEGEVIFSEIVRRYDETKITAKENYKNIPGIAYKKDERVYYTGLMPLIGDLDTIPFPARDLIELCEYEGWPIKKENFETTLISSRGCPFYCHFCSNPVWKLQKPWLRLRSPENIVDEIEELVNVYGVNEYFDQCDELNHLPKWATEVCEEKKRRKLDIPWKVCLRADKITERFAKALADSNCWYVHIGIESGNQGTLNGLGKKITLDQVIEGCKVLKRHNIEIMGLFMLFNAWEDGGNLRFENLKMTENTLKFARKLIHDGLIDYMSWSQATAYPGSKLWETATKYGLIPDKYIGKWENWTHVHDFTMDLPGVSGRDRMKIKYKGSMIQAWCVLKSGKLSNKRYLFERGLGLIKRIGLKMG